MKLSRGPYSQVRKKVYEIFKKKGDCFLQDFIESGNHFLGSKKESLIAYKLIYDEFKFLDKALISTVRELQANSNDFKCLDVGCGFGINLEMLQDEGLFHKSGFYALEHAKEGDNFFERASRFLEEKFGVRQENIIEGDITYTRGIEDLGLEFDLVYARGILPVLKDTESAINNLKRLTKEGGSIFFDIYDPEGYTTLPSFGKIKNIELGRIWYALNEDYKASFKWNKEGSVEFSLNKLYLKAPTRETYSFLKHLLPLGLISQALNRIFWNPIYFWHSSDYIRKILLNEGLEVVEHEKSDASPKAYFVAKKTCSD